MRVQVDREKCLGSGLCLLKAPTVFDQDDEGLVLLLEAQPGTSAEEAVRNAEKSCPAEAITVSPPAAN
jgi:ferredoxin